MSDTPRTDAINKGYDWLTVPTVFARQLEREINAMRDTSERNKWMCEVMEMALVEWKRRAEHAEAELRKIAEGK